MAIQAEEGDNGNRVSATVDAPVAHRVPRAVASTSADVTLAAEQKPSPTKTHSAQLTDAAEEIHACCSANLTDHAKAG